MCISLPKNSSPLVRRQLPHQTARYPTIQSVRKNAVRQRRRFYCSQGRGRSSSDARVVCRLSGMQPYPGYVQLPNRSDVMTGEKWQTLAEKYDPSSIAPERYDAFLEKLCEAGHLTLKIRPFWDTPGISLYLWKSQKEHVVLIWLIAPIFRQSAMFGNPSTMLNVLISYTGTTGKTGNIMIGTRVAK